MLMSTPSAQHQEINLRCPYCNDELEKGYLITNGRRLIFSDQKWKLFYTVEDNEILLDAHKLAAYHTAYICRNCKKIIIEYN